MSLFVAVAETGSFQAAAGQFQLSPPAVTRAIAALEEFLGAKLLRRTTRKVVLTEVGAHYLADCRRILGELQEAEESAAGSFAAARGLLQVTAPVLFGQLYVLPALLEFLDQHPEVQARTLFVDRVVHLLEEGLDVAVRIGHLPDSSLIAAPAGAVRRVVVASPAYLQRCGIPRHPRELAQHRVIATPTAAGQWNFQSAGKTLAVPISPRLTVNTNAAAIHSAVAGWGLTRVLSYQITQELARGELQILLTDFEPQPWPVYVLHQEGRKVSARVRAFVDHLSARLRQNRSFSAPGSVD